MEKITLNESETTQRFLKAKKVNRNDQIGTVKPVSKLWSTMIYQMSPFGKLQMG